MHSSILRKDNTYFLSVGDSVLDQLKTPSTMEILYGARRKKERKRRITYKIRSYAYTHRTYRNEVLQDMWESRILKEGNA